MNTNKRTEISKLGEFGLIEHLTSGITPANKETVAGVGDDAAVLRFDSETDVLVSTDLLMEGINFDLCIGVSAGSANWSKPTAFRESVWKVSGPTNSVAALVITTVTSSPAATNSLTSSHALYAAIEPVTPSSIFLFIRSADSRSD